MYALCSSHHLLTHTYAHTHVYTPTVCLQSVEMMDPVFHVSGMDSVDQGMALETPMLKGQEHILRYYSQASGASATRQVADCCGAVHRRQAALLPRDDVLPLRFLSLSCVSPPPQFDRAFHYLRYYAGYQMSKNVTLSEKLANAASIDELHSLVGDDFWSV